MTIEELKESGLIGYEYVRGSTLYGTSLPDGKSDIDIGGVYVLPNERITGLPCKYIPQVSDEKHDTTYYELNRWAELLLNSNPTALESLFVPKDKINGDVHPAIQLFLDNREMFLSKKIFKTLNGYAYEQIRKARGLNKKIVNPVTERKDVLDFCYTFKNQGSTPVKEWLKERGLKQEYCGLVNIPNMRETYAVFYDFGNHMLSENISRSDFLDAYCSVKETPLSKFVNTVTKIVVGFNGMSAEYVYNQIPKAIGYRGIVGVDGMSNEVRLSSIPKGEVPIFHLVYNKDAYTCHCRDYKEYKEWEENRNPVRYESNLHKNYDSKNMYNVVRLMHMGLELAKGEGFNVVRTWDRQMLLDIRMHKFEYDELIKYAEEKKAEVEELIKTSNLPDEVDSDKVNELPIEARKLC